MELLQLATLAARMLQMACERDQIGRHTEILPHEEAVAALALTRIESRIATTPAEGLHGLVVKLGLDRFLHEHADAASEQADSAYADLVRLTGHDPVSEILAKLRSSSRH